MSVSRRRFLNSGIGIGVIAATGWPLGIEQSLVMDERGQPYMTPAMAERGRLQA